MPLVDVLPLLVDQLVAADACRLMRCGRAVHAAMEGHPDLWARFQRHMRVRPRRGRAATRRSVVAAILGALSTRCRECGRRTRGGGHLARGGLFARGGHRDFIPVCGACRRDGFRAMVTRADAARRGVLRRSGWTLHPRALARLTRCAIVRGRGAHLYWLSDVRRLVAILSPTLPSRP